MHRWMQDLKGLKPLPVAIAYFLMSTSLVLLASVAFPALTAPEWALRLLFAILAMTAPFVVVMAWALSAGPPVGARVQRRVGDPNETRKD